MPVRNRTKDDRVQVCGTFAGPLSNPPWVQSHCGIHGWTTTCGDFVGNPHGDNNFLLTRQAQANSLLNGTWGAGIGTRVATNCPLFGAMVSPPSAPPSFQRPALDNAAFVLSAGTEAMARSNPQKADVLLPAFLGELRDFPSTVSGVVQLAGFTGSFLRKVDNLRSLPDLVRTNGSEFARQIANGNLNWRFGISPMVGDVRKLFKFAEMTERRYRYFRKLRDGKVLSRNVTLYSNILRYDQPVTTISSQYGTLIRAVPQVSHSVKEWASVRWIAPSGPNLPSDDDALRRIARHSALGMTSQHLLETAWELTPWSWLGDWFSNFGDFVKATNNSLGIRAGTMCLMRHTIDRVDYRITQKPAGSTITGVPSRWREVKRRHVVGTPLAFPLLSLPVLSTGQWSILGSLSVARGLRSRT